ncbi:oligomycin resistance ATP-dependent permease yor1, putative [Talaromyces stipitatus ATCC 10500]|uniref:Oligomycin resistance ATP-dependent permease yor1, putative n=1 Tax=Talaromyces stipitatus (strain ATCC 10500 / CBS 375.48 / QM 6759 / NRRL 1006) TaxID=441959 RepID=B8M9W7_TALSN|nr:oligomycin resistance ATP-dependent permease yor1, putative [Talaromyces stipitatus ATCC 10500]EED18119.1 oligomycin resistance ATP-dependent permease yor1, putative [Talaromyces stipitatus ATCC 10500]
MSEAREEGKIPSTKRPWLSRLNPLKRRRPPPIPDERVESPEYKANIASLITWQWINHLMFVGYNRPLEENDIPRVNASRSIDVIATKLQANFEKRVKSKSKHALVGAIYETFKFDIVLGGVCCAIGSVTQIILPYLLKYLIAFATDAYLSRYTHQPEPSVGKGLGWVFGLSAMQILASIGNNQFMYRGMVVGGEIRAALISLIFSKAMTISGRAKAGWKPSKTPPADITPGSDEENAWYAEQLEEAQMSVQGWSNGRIINLMSTDTNRIDKAAGWFHFIWTIPLTVLITIALLLVNLTYSALPGIGLFFLSAPLLALAVKRIFQTRARVNKFTDERVSLTQEVLQAIRFVKYYAWESDFLNRISAIRHKEIRGVQVMFMIRNLLTAIGTSVPMFASMLAFITYSLTNHSLVPASIFSSLSLFNGLRLPAMLLPMVIALVSDASSAVTRIEEFLLAEDTQVEMQPQTVDSENAVSMVDAAFTWEKAVDDKDHKKGALGKEAKNKNKKNKKGVGKTEKISEKTEKSSETSSTDGDGKAHEDATAKEPFKIHGLNVQVAKREFLGVVGSVGSGKTSFLASLAGEMRKISGDAVIGGSKAYCPQNAWIQNATVQDNITFGQELDEEKFKRVVEACSLRHDLQILPNGRYTQIGERGINLSGGQKARISLARAIYADTDILLLDDPLSAVDAHVGRHIMENALCGLLQDKCRILATHQLHVLHHCDRIIMMENGMIVANDTFDNLFAHNERFKEMMTTVNQDHKDEEVEMPAAPETTVQKIASIAKQPGEDLIQEESNSASGVSTGIYFRYYAAAGSVLLLPMIVLLLILSQGGAIVTNLWLAWWTSNKFHFPTGTYIGVYAALGVGQAILLFIYTTSLSITGTRSSRQLLKRAIRRVLHAPVSFFDTTPLGRIMNRFSKDVDTLDNNMTDSMRIATITMAQIIGVFILIIAYYYYFAAALGPLLVMYISLALFYNTSAREIQKHESRLRGRLFSRFNESIYGTATIRAYGRSASFVKSINNDIDQMDSAYFLTFANQRWLAVRLDVLGVILVFVTEILVVTDRFNVSPSISGLVLSYLLTSVQMLQFTVRQAADVDNNMDSVERIDYYGRQIEQEAPAHTIPVPEEWPSRGEVIFQNAHLRYRPRLPFALEEFNLHIQPGERVGIVGRTGAGKSTIIMALFRMVELAEGCIIMDGIDISAIGLNDLRSRMSIIPQDPTLFRGTIRSNLDPFNTRTDEELWAALRQSHLIDDTTSTETTTNKATNNNKTQPSQITLDSIVEEGGNNFSLGQRQLLALARALVRNSKITICDEATSSIDFETDLKIQRAMSEGFKGRTLLCIAHRLKTIIGYDRICVMDRGRVAEVATPLELFDKGGIFRSMCEQSSITREIIVASKLESAVDGDKGGM